jgi:hypothetical protein
MVSRWQSWLVLLSKYYLGDKIKEDEMGGTCGTYGGEVYTGVRILVGNKKESDSLKDLGVDGRIILKLMVKHSFGKAWIGFIWFRIGTSGGLLCTR